MLKTARSYEEACRTFRWRVPERYNVAFDVCDRQTMAGADGHRTALIIDCGDQPPERYTFHVLRLLSNRLANVLAARGIGPTDRVALALPPGIEAAAAVLAVLKMGAVVVPLPLHLGEEPLTWRLGDSGAVAAIVGEAQAARLRAAAAEPACAVRAVLVAGAAPDGTEDMWQAMAVAGDAFSPAVTNPDSPAWLFYPPHGMGHPAGVVLGHGAFLGGLPAVEFGLGFFPQFGDIVWTSADWMGFEALLWAVLPAWHHGAVVVSGGFGAPPQEWLAVMGRQGVRTVWAPPAHLAAMVQAGLTHPHPLPRVIASGPDPLPESLQDQVRKVFAIPANEIWGGPETGAAAANNWSVMERRSGSPGRAAPGVTVEAVDKLGRVLRAGDVGVLAVAPGAPGACLGLWDGDGGWQAARAAGGWQAGTRLGRRDLDGYLWPEPEDLPPGMVRLNGIPVVLADIETALTWHSRVKAAGVVVMDTGELKAFVVPVGAGGDAHLAHEIQAYVASRRGAHEVPNRIEFVAAIPRKADGVTDADALRSRAVRLDAPDPSLRL